MATTAMDDHDTCTVPAGCPHLAIFSPIHLTQPSAACRFWPIVLIASMLSLMTITIIQLCVVFDDHHNHSAAPLADMDMHFLLLTSMPNYADGFMSKASTYAFTIKICVQV